MTQDSIPSDGLIAHSLDEYETCDIADAIEEFGVRLRNQGFTDSSIQCRFPSLPPLVGNAVTVQIRSASPPISGGCMIEHSTWWDAFEAVPAPRVLVIEDVDRHPGTGALVGKTHARIFGVFGAAGIVTNGAVRDLPALERMGMRVFSGSVAVSHAYAHIVAVGRTVHVGGLAISPGDLLHGDLHGIVQIPPNLIARIHSAIERRKEHDRRIVELCSSSDLSVSALKAAIEERDGLPGLNRA